MLFSDLIQTLGCLNDHRSNPQLKRRREMEITDPPISQSQEHQQNTLREPGILDEPRQRQIATAELGPPTLMQTSSSTLPTNPWDVNNFLSPQLCNIQKSHIQQPFMTSQVGSNLTMQNINSTSPFVAGANFHPTLSSDVPHSLDPHPHLQVRGSETFNLSDDLFAMWSNLPVGFRYAILFRIVARNNSLDDLVPKIGIYFFQHQDHDTRVLLTTHNALFIT